MTTAPARWTYAGPVSRALAWSMDAGVVVVLGIGGAALIGLITSVLGVRTHDMALVVASVCLGALPVLLAVYFAVFWAVAGRTPGMALLGLRVVAGSSRRPSWPAAVVRAAVLTYFPVGALWALVDRRRQGVHDKVSRTVVVRVHAVP
jgi:uncharacterized RDD family membrane protein YckC